MAQRSVLKRQARSQRSQAIEEGTTLVPSGHTARAGLEATLRGVELVQYIKECLLLRWLQAEGGEAASRRRRKLEPPPSPAMGERAHDLHRHELRGWASPAALGSGARRCCWDRGVGAGDGCAHAKGGSVQRCEEAVVAQKQRESRAPARPEQTAVAHGGRGCEACGPPRASVWPDQRTACSPPRHSRGNVRGRRRRGP